MKTLFKVFIGAVLFFIFLSFTGLGKADNLEVIKIAVRMDLEDLAESRLNYKSTFRTKSFFLIGNEATLYYSGKNAFGIESSFALYADVKYNLETTAYSINNIRTKE